VAARKKWRKRNINKKSGMYEDGLLNCGGLKAFVVNVVNII
jgi:hypothetical protein